jgi:spermidine synthase
MKAWFSEKRAINPMYSPGPGENNRNISLNLFIVGFVSTSVQLLFMREIMNLTGGYELVTGIFLGSWLTVSAAGSVLAGRSRFSDLRLINLLFALSLFLSLFLLVILTRIMTGPGETPDFLKSLVITFLMLIPFCLASGYIFIKLISAARTRNDFVPGKSFSIETTGGILAGFIFSILTSGLLNTGQILVVILVSSMAYALLAYLPPGSISDYLSRCLIAVITAGALIAGPDVLLRQMLMPGIRVADTKDTPYGNITKGLYGEEESIYYNQRLLSYSEDAVEREENIHYALLPVKNPEKILLVSGNLSSCLTEIEKYNPEKVIYVENDPGLIEMTAVSKDAFSFNIDIEMRDAGKYIRETKEKTDAVIVLLPPPSTLALNRYYTSEFFAHIRNIINPGGIFMCSPGSYDFYMNRESVLLYSSVYNSLKEVFTYVRPVAGHKLYFISSDSEFSLSFSGMTEEKQINNIYVSPDFLSDDLIELKSNEILSVLDENVKKNRSASPIACFYYQSYNLSRYPHAKTLAVAVSVIIFALSLLTIRRKNILMYFTASSLAGFEIIILLILQITIGNMYQLTGMVIASLMTGLAAGSGFQRRYAGTFHARTLSLILIIYYMLFAACIKPLMTVTGTAGIILITAAVFPPSFITGHLFRILTVHDSEGSVSSSVYSADLAGSAVGFILVSAIMVPVFGIAVSIIFLSALILTGMLFGGNKIK